MGSGTRKLRRTSARKVASRFQVLLLIGDDLNEFVRASLHAAQSDSIMAEHSDKWGSRWLMLPNPTYGSWMTALPMVDEYDPTRSERDALHQGEN